MQYENIRKAVFLSRPNRFIARILYGGKEQICHVKNTGRCKELLVPGCDIYVQEFTRDLPENAHRKTDFDLIAVRKGERLINMDSLAPNKVAAELLPTLYPGLRSFLPEQRFGDSRFDFAGDYAVTLPCDSDDGRGQTQILKKFFLEVKGVTLEQNGVVYFPDAPTERGRKHLRELCTALSAGYDAGVLFLVQMEHVMGFAPSEETDPAFSAALDDAIAAGVRIFIYDCHVTETGITAGSPIPFLRNAGRMEGNSLVIDPSGRKI